MNDFTDAIFYYDVPTQDGLLKFFQTSPYLNNTISINYARLVYMTQKPFGEASISTSRSDQTWYKVIHKRKAGRRVSTSYDTVLSVASEFGFAAGTGIHRLLSAVPKKKIRRVNTSRAATDVLTGAHTSILSDLSQLYDVAPNEFKISGSAAAFNLSYGSLHDIDIVVPVRDKPHLEAINRQAKRPSSYKSVPLGPGLSKALKRKTSALRWRHDSGKIICPFFVYDKTVPPVLSAIPINSYVEGKVVIINSKHGIFNTQFFESEGAIGKIMVCSTIARGEIEEGMRFKVNCPIYVVNKGLWSGDFIAVVNAPYIDFGNSVLSGK